MQFLEASSPTIHGERSMTHVPSTISAQSSRKPNSNEGGKRANKSTVTALLHHPEAPMRSTASRLDLMLCCCTKIDFKLSNKALVFWQHRSPVIRRAHSESNTRTGSPAQASAILLLDLDVCFYLVSSSFSTFGRGGCKAWALPIKV
jgi:hypothetical protein